MDEKATQLHAIASLKVLLDATKPQNGSSSATAANHVTMTSQLSQETRLAVSEQPNGVAPGVEDAGDNVSNVVLIIILWLSKTCLKPAAKTVLIFMLILLLL